MDDRTDLFTIGQLARRTGLTVRTIRFWSDLDLLPPTTRSGGGYRLYDAGAVARLELVRSLRALRRVREMAVAGSADVPPEPLPSVEPARAALAAGIAPDSAEARAVLDEMVDPALSPAERGALADRIATFTDRRVERYWHLVGVLNRRPPFPSTVPAVEWLAAALRAAR